MTEKFLTKPPPRYVFDIIMNTMAATGFPKGIFSEDELNVKYFDENPQNKVEIFQKAIDITKIVLNEKFEIKAKNILRGDEADKTNYFLQCFGKAATSGKDFPKFIKKYLDLKQKRAEEKVDEVVKKPDEVVKKPDEVKKPEEKKPEKSTEKVKDSSSKVAPKVEAKEDPKNKPKDTKEVKPAEKPKEGNTGNVGQANVRPQTPVKKAPKTTTNTEEIKEDSTKV